MASTHQTELELTEAGVQHLVIEQVRRETTGGLSLSSATLLEGGRIPVECTGDGNDLSPDLVWGPLPPDTREVVVLCEDATVQGTPYLHWLLYGLPADTLEIPAGIEKTARPRIPKGAKQTRNSAGTWGYFGPRPPAGGRIHNYHFQVIVLNAPIRLPEDGNRDQLISVMKNHVLVFGEIIGWYARQ